MRLSSACFPSYWPERFFASSGGRTRRLNVTLPWKMTASDERADIQEAFFFYDKLGDGKIALTQVKHTIQVTPP